MAFSQKRQQEQEEVVKKIKINEMRGKNIKYTSITCIICNKFYHLFTFWQRQKFVVVFFWVNVCRAVIYLNLQ